MPSSHNLFKPMNTLGGPQSQHHTRSRDQRDRPAARQGYLLRSERRNPTSTRVQPKSPERQASPKRRRTGRQSYAAPNTHNGAEENTEDEEDPISRTAHQLNTRSNGKQKAHVDPTNDRENSFNRMMTQREYLGVESMMNSESYVDWSPLKRDQEDAFSAASLWKLKSGYDVPQDIVRTRSLGLNDALAPAKSPFEESPSISSSKLKVRLEHSTPTPDTSSEVIELVSPQRKTKRYAVQNSNVSSKQAGPSELPFSANTGHAQGMRSPAVLKVAKDNDIQHTSSKGNAVPLRRRHVDSNHIFKLNSLIIGTRVLGDGMALSLEEGSDDMQFYRGDKSLEHSLPFDSVVRGEASTIETGRKIRIMVRQPQSSWVHMELEVNEDYVLILDMIESYVGKTLKRVDDEWMTKVRNKWIHDCQEHGSTAIGRDAAAEFLQDIRKTPTTVKEKTVGSVRTQQGKIVSQLQTASGNRNETGPMKSHVDAFVQPVGRTLPQRTTRSQNQLAATGESKEGIIPRKETGNRNIASPLEQLDHSMAWKRPLVYPSNGKRKATVEFEDLQRLDEGEFLNDNLIWFFLRYLMEQMESTRPEDAKRVYWFNSYFFEKLTSEPRLRQGINYDAVKRWTKDVDLFNYDYIVVPVNEAAHWYIAILCNLPSLFQSSTAYSEEHVQAPGSSPHHPIGIEDSQPNAEANLVDATKILPEDTAPNLDKNGATFTVPESEDDEEVDTPPASGFRKRIARDAEEQSLFLSSNRIPDDIGHNELSKTELIPAIKATAKQTDQTGGDTSNLKSKEARSTKKKRSFGRIFEATTPSIIVLDSLGLTHQQTTKFLKLYLVEEAREKKGETPFDTTDIQGINAKGIPQQDNFCDCGLYLLGYMLKFVEDPRKFVTLLLRRESDVDEGWPDLCPKSMRARIRELIQELHREQMLERKSRKRSRLNATDSNQTREVEKSQVVAASSPIAAQCSSDPTRGAMPEVSGLKNEIVESSQPVGNPTAVGFESHTTAVSTEAQRFPAATGNAPAEDGLLKTQTIIPDSQPNESSQVEGNENHEARLSDTRAIQLIVRQQQLIDQPSDTEMLDPPEPEDDFAGSNPYVAATPEMEPIKNAKSPGDFVDQLKQAAANRGQHEPETDLREQLLQAASIGADQHAEAMGLSKEYVNMDQLY